MQTKLINAFKNLFETHSPEQQHSNSVFSSFRDTPLSLKNVYYYCTCDLLFACYQLLSGQEALPARPQCHHVSQLKVNGTDLCNSLPEQ